jgi:murein DD-endopeptidase MepM/ murein hydrolase activator NlpD
MGGSQDTSHLEGLLAKVSARRGITLRRAFLRVAGPFPVAGPAAWTNDWHAPRPCPYPHLHQGLDIFANRGTPVVAVRNSVVTGVISDPVTGLGLQITDGNGIDYLYAHLTAYADGVTSGQRLHRGEVIGFVGNTGDASGGATHLHFQIMPGGIPMPPKPLVDRWLLGEMARATALLGHGRHRSVEVGGGNPWRWRLLVEEQMSALATSGVVSASVDQPAPTSAAVRTAPVTDTTSLTAAPLGVLAGMGGALVLAFFARRRSPASPPPASRSTRK